MRPSLKFACCTLYRVGIEECSLDFFLIRDRPYVFLVGGGAGDFFQHVKLDFFNKVKAFIFVTTKVFLQLLQCISPIRVFILISNLRSFNKKSS